MKIQCFFSISKHITLIGKPFTYDWNANWFVYEIAFNWYYSFMDPTMREKKEIKSECDSYSKISDHTKVFKNLGCECDVLRCSSWFGSFSRRFKSW